MWTLFFAGIRKEPLWRFAAQDKIKRSKNVPSIWRDTPLRVSRHIDGVFLIYGRQTG
jgi:hypothetical protein